MAKYTLNLQKNINGLRSSAVLQKDKYKENQMQAMSSQTPENQK